MYSVSSFTDVRPAANARISRSIGATISNQGSSEFHLVKKYPWLLTVSCDINDTMYVETGHRVEQRPSVKRYGHIPDHLVCYGAHLVGKAVLMTSVFLRCDSELSRRLLDLFSEDGPCGIGQLCDKAGKGMNASVLEGSPYPEVYVQMASLSHLISYSHLSFMGEFRALIFMVQRHIAYLVMHVKVLEEAFFLASRDFNEMRRHK